MCSIHFAMMLMMIFAMMFLKRDIFFWMTLRYLHWFWELEKNIQFWLFAFLYHVLLIFNWTYQNENDNRYEWKGEIVVLIGKWKKGKKFERNAFVGEKYDAQIFRFLIATWKIVNYIRNQEIAMLMMSNWKWKTYAAMEIALDVQNIL